MALTPTLGFGQAGNASSAEFPDLAVRMTSLTAVTGFEHQLVDSLLAWLPGAVRDRAGNAVVVLGSGNRSRLVACPVSEPGFVVGQVRDDGWLTLRRAPGPVRPSFDAQLEGQPVTLSGRRGQVPGVTAVRSIHLTRGRDDVGGDDFTVDSAYVDIGAGSAAQVAAAGVGVLTPVALAKRPVRYGADLLAAPAAGRRSACAALVLAARRAIAERGMVPRDERIVIAFVVEQELLAHGLAAVATARGPFTETLLVDGAPGEAGSLSRTTDTLPPFRRAFGTLNRWSLGARYPGTPVETVTLSGADSLRAALVGWLGGRR